MEIKINVDETMFKDVLEKELNAFSKEELHEIIRECIAEVLRSDITLRGFFIKPKDYSYDIDRPSDVLIEAAKNINLSPAYEEIQEKLISELKTNYKQLLQNVMLNIMIEGLCENGTFRENLRYAMRDIMR